MEKIECKKCGAGNSLSPPIRCWYCGQIIVVKNHLQGRHNGHPKSSHNFRGVGTEKEKPNE